MSAFPGFVDRSYVAQSPNADCERTINLILEQMEGQGKNRFTFYRSPGLASFIETGSGAARGILPLNGFIWAVIGSGLYLFDPSGAAVGPARAIVDDGANVSMAADPDTLVVVSANLAYAADGIAPFIHLITWMGEPVSKTAFLDTYFLFLAAKGDGFFFSEPGDAQTGDPLTNFVSAEASANKYIDMLVTREEAWLFGSQISQVFYNNSANDPTNPFLPNLSAVIPWGTVSPNAAVSFDGRVGWLAKSATAQAVAVLTNGGFTPQRVSTHAVEYRWSQYSTVEDAISMGFTIKGHPLWRIWFPSANETWEYDLSVNDWREVAWWNSDEGKYEAHRGRCAAAEFGTILIGDREHNRIYKCSMDYLDDAGDRIRWMRRAPILTNENKRTSYPWFELDIQPGVGSNLADENSPERDPQIEMRFSNNWAQTFSTPRQRSMGKQGEYSKRVIWKRNGASRQRVFEATGSASVPTVINNCYLREPRQRST